MKKRDHRSIEKHSESILRPLELSQSSGRLIDSVILIDDLIHLLTSSLKKDGLHISDISG